MSDPRQQLSLLVAQREALEIEADALHSELSAPTPAGGPPPGLKGTFVDAEGYPRGDIDIVNVLQKRQRLAVINTDHKSLMKQIEQILKSVHVLMSAEHGPVTARAPTIAAETPSSVFTGIAAALDKGFALIDEVSEASPAMGGGLRCGDEVLSFGPISNKVSSEPLSLIPKVVQQNMNKPIPIRVSRNSEIIELHITPSTWNGRGVLGCHLTPL